MSPSRSNKYPLTSIEEGEVHNLSTAFPDRHTITMRQLKALQETISGPSPSDLKPTIDALEALRKAINASFDTLISLGLDSDPFHDVPSLTKVTDVTVLNVSAFRIALEKLTKAIERLGQAGTQAEVDLKRDTDSDDEEDIRENVTLLVKAAETIREGFRKMAISMVSG